MEKLSIILEDGVEKEVNCLFYLYNSKYYFVYTTKEIDENGYVVLYLSQIGKEVKNTERGPVETGFMIGAEITDPEEWKNVQTSISKIVETAKTKVADPDIQILPLSMLQKMKIVGKKKFRLLKDIVKNDLNVEFEEAVTTPNPTVAENSPATNSNEVTVVIDYRAEFFEEQRKNEELTKQLESLNNKLVEIQKIISENN